MDQKISVKMSDPQVDKDIRGSPLPVQLTTIEEAIEKALLGHMTNLLSDTHMVATYALPNALGKGVRCRVTPINDGKNWRIVISPK